MSKAAAQPVAAAAETTVVEGGDIEVLPRDGRVTVTLTASGGQWASITVSPLGARRMAKALLYGARVAVEQHHEG